MNQNSLYAFSIETNQHQSGAFGVRIILCLDTQTKAMNQSLQLNRYTIHKNQCSSLIPSLDRSENMQLLEP